MTHLTSTLVILASILTPFAAANLHHSAVCVSSAAGVYIYQESATRAACAKYNARNTGNKQWDKCPDCAVHYLGKLNVCHSSAWHIGGDEFQYYCGQLGGYGALAN